MRNAYLCIIPGEVAAKSDVEIVNVLGVGVALKDGCGVFPDDGKSAWLPAKVASLCGIHVDWTAAHDEVKEKKTEK